MKKLAYTTPVVEVTKWESQDIITTSGLVSVSVDTVSTIGDANVTASVSYDDLQ